MALLSRVYGANLDTREEAEGLALRCMLVGGFLTFAQAHSLARKGRATARHLLLYALWLGEPAALELALKQVGKGEDRVPESALEAVQARCLLMALEGKGKAALREFAKLAPDATTWPFAASAAEFARGVFAVQLAFAAGNDAKQAQAQCEAQLRRLPAEITHDLLLRAIHFKNTLSLKRRSPAADEEAARARAFFAAHARRGYRGLASP
jgi:hypothetical protein